MRERALALALACCCVAAAHGDTSSPRGAAPALRAVALAGPYATLDAYCAQATWPDPRPGFVGDNTCAREDVARVALAPPFLEVAGVAVGLSGHGKMHLAFRLAAGWFVDEETELHYDVARSRGDAAIAAAEVRDGRLVVTGVASAWHKTLGAPDDDAQLDEYACFAAVLVCGGASCTAPLPVGGTLRCGESWGSRRALARWSRWQWQLDVRVAGGTLALGARDVTRLPARMPRGYASRLDNLPAQTRAAVGVRALPF